MDLGPLHYSSRDLRVRCLRVSLLHKKITGSLARDHYSKLDEYGEYHQIQPEYTTMSRAKGIGNKWFTKFHADVFPSDEIILRGKKMKPPRYYDQLFDISCPSEMEEVKFKRHQTARQNWTDNTPERLRVKEQINEAKLQTLIRNWEKNGK